MERGTTEWGSGKGRMGKEENMDNKEKNGKKAL